MLRRLAILAILLYGGDALAQTTCSATCRACGSTTGSAAAWDGGAFSTAATGPTGCANPAYSFTADTNAGLCLAAANDVSIQNTATAGTGTVLRMADGSGVYFYTYDGGNANGFNIGSAAHDFRFVLNGGTPFVLDATLGSGLIVGKGSNAAVARSIAAGTGVAVSNGDGQSGNPTVSTDTAVVNTFSSGTGDVPATGAVGTYYFETDVPGMYAYPATDTEHWVLSIAAGTAQGDLFYASGVDVLAALAKDANATRYLSNTGASNNPAWAQVNLTNGVTGDLPFANVAQASGASVLLGRGSAAGAGDFQEVTLGSGLTMTGTVLSSSGGSSLLMYGHAGGVQANSGATEYLPMWGGGNTVSTTEANREVVIAKACTLGNLYIRTQDAQSGTGALVLTIRKNAADTAVTVTISAGAAAGTFSDTSNTVAVAAGDRVAMKLANAASAGSAFINGWSLTCS